MKASPDEYFVAVVTGKNLIKGQQKTNQLYVYRKKSIITDWEETIEYYLDIRLVLKDNPLFNDVSM